MDFSLKNKEEKKLFELHIAFNAELLKELFFSKSGIWNYVYHFLISLALLYSFATIQIFLPNYFPEIPLYPLALFFAYLAANYPVISVYLLCFPAGIMIDAALYQNIGTNVILLLFTVFVVNLLNRKVKDFLTALLISASGIFAYILSNLIFFAGKLSLNERFALMPKQLFLATLINCLAAPAIFTVIDFVLNVFSKSKTRKTNSEV